MAKVLYYDYLDQLIELFVSNKASWNQPHLLSLLLISLGNPQYYLCFLFSFFFFLTSWFPCMLELLLSVYIPCFLTSYKSFLLLSLEKWTPFYFSVILYIYIVHASFQQRCFLCNLLSFWISYLIWQRCERWKIQ